MIAQARELAELEAVNCTFMTADAEQLPFAEGSFDVVIARNLTWNLPDPTQAYRDWMRVLAPGGMLLNYDAEYAKDHHQQKLPTLNAHANLSQTLLEECHNIYHMLPISIYERPHWDLELLRSLATATAVLINPLGSGFTGRKTFFISLCPCSASKQLSYDCKKIKNA